MDQVRDPLFERMVAVGDSVMQGCVNVGVSVWSQPFGLPALLARQAGATLPLPLIAPPGYPPHVNHLGPMLRGLVGRRRTLIPQRVNPDERPRNFAVAGARLADVVQLTCANAHRLPPVRAVRRLTRLTRLVLNPLAEPDLEDRSQLDRAIAEDPSLVLVWAGNNDLLETIFFPGAGITPPLEFGRWWRVLIERLLSETSARIVVLTLPDVTILPILRLWRRRQRFQGLIRRTIDGYNAIIRASAARSDRVLVADVEDGLREMATGISTAGWDLPYRVARGRLDFAPLVGWPGVIQSGGLVSLDGLHPTPTGYAALTNGLIDLLDEKWGLDLPRIDLARIAAADPVLQRVDPWSWLGIASYLRIGAARDIAALEQERWPIELWRERVLPPGVRDAAD